MTFKKGEISNPKGRPKLEHTISDQIKKLLRTRETPRKGKRGITRAMKVAEKITQLAEDGNLWAANIVLDRVEGKVKQPVGLEGGQEPIKVDLGDEITAKLANIYSVIPKPEDK